MQTIFKRLVLFMSMILVAGCNTVPVSNQNLTPSPTTNDMASSNLELGIAYLQEGNYDKALQKLMKAKEYDPNYSPTYNVLGLLYQQLGQNDNAEENFKYAIRLNSADSASMNNYGRFLCALGRVEEGEETLLQAAANPLYETPEKAITNAGVCVFNNGQTDKAKTYLQKALSMDPVIPQALLLLSEILYKQNDALGARDYFQRYKQTARHTPKSLWLGIQIEQKLDNVDAVSSYAMLLKNTFPDSPEAEKIRQANIR